MEEASADVHQRNARHNDFALLIASKNDHPAVVEYLLSKGADVDMVNSLGQTALYWAALRGNAKVAKVLVTGSEGQRADPAIRTNEGYTALYASAQEGYMVCCLAHSLLQNIYFFKKKPQKIFFPFENFYMGPVSYKKV